MGEDTKEIEKMIEDEAKSGDIEDKATVEKSSLDKRKSKAVTFKFPG